MIWDILGTVTGNFNQIYWFYLLTQSASQSEMQLSTYWMPKMWHHSKQQKFWRTKPKQPLPDVANTQFEGRAVHIKQTVSSVNTWSVNTDKRKRTGGRRGTCGTDKGWLGITRIKNQEKKERSDLNSFGCEVELRKEKRKEKNKENWWTRVNLQPARLGPNKPQMSKPCPLSRKPICRLSTHPYSQRSRQSLLRSRWKRMCSCEKIPDAYWVLTLCQALF